jgi:formylglycine-generating enzyme required for sulfatase activity
MLPIGARFCIDRYEASTVSLDAQDRPIGPHSPYEMSSRDRVRAESKPGVHPQAHVTLLQAKAACELAGKRLCSDAEWLRACKGPDGHDFPYGADHERDSCNERASSPLYKLFGSEPPASVLKSPVAMNNPRINQLGGLAKTGAFAGCKTKEGVFDMVGNLHEWTSDPRGTFRGGYYRDARQHGLGCNYVTKGHDALYRDYSTGFRCCREPSRAP